MTVVTPSTTDRLAGTAAAATTARLTGTPGASTTDRTSAAATASSTDRVAIIKGKLWSFLAWSFAADTFILPLLTDVEGFPFGASTTTRISGIATTSLTDRV